MKAIENTEQMVSASNNMNNEKYESDSCKKQLSPKNIAQIVYLCQALSFFFGITAIAGVILN